MGQFRRRNFLTATGALLVAPHFARAQARLPVVGFLLPSLKPTPEVEAERDAKSPFVAHLRKLGWVEGKTFTAERAYGGPTFEGLSKAATQLVEKKVDVIWTFGRHASVAAARATGSIPIVFCNASFPVEAGLIDSFARPGRNVTGVAWYVDVSVFLKTVEFLREIVPNARRLAILAERVTTPAVAGGLLDLTSFYRRMDAGLGKLGYEPKRFWLAKESGLERSLAAVESWGPDCLRIRTTQIAIRFRKEIMAFARRSKLPDAYDSRQWIAAGGLVSYGASLLPVLLRSAEMIDRVLRGAKPAEIPVELPTKYDLTVNLKTAAALGLTIPQAILLRADRVFE